MGSGHVDPVAMCVRGATGDTPFAIDWRTRVATLDPGGAGLRVRRLRWGEKRALAAFCNQPAAFREDQFLALCAGTVAEDLREAALALALWFDDPAGDALTFDPMRLAEAALALHSAFGLPLSTYDDDDAGDVDALARAAENASLVRAASLRDQRAAAFGAERPGPLRAMHTAPPYKEPPATEGDDGFTVIRVVPDQKEAATAALLPPHGALASNSAILMPIVARDAEAMLAPAPAQPSPRSERHEAFGSAAKSALAPLPSPGAPQAAMRARPRIAVALEFSRPTGLAPAGPAAAPRVAVAIATAPTASHTSASHLLSAHPLPTPSPLSRAHRPEPLPNRPAAAHVPDPPGYASPSCAAIATIPQPRRGGAASPLPIVAASPTLDARLARLLALVSDPTDRAAQVEASLSIEEWI